MRRRRRLAPVPRIVRRQGAEGGDANDPLAGDSPEGEDRHRGGAQAHGRQHSVSVFSSASDARCSPVAVHVEGAGDGEY